MNVDSIKCKDTKLNDSIQVILNVLDETLRNPFTKVKKIFFLISKKNAFLLNKKNNYLAKIEKRKQIE